MNTEVGHGWPEMCWWDGIEGGWDVLGVRAGLTVVVLMAAQLATRTSQSPQKATATCSRSTPPAWSGAPWSPKGGPHLPGCSRVARKFWFHQSRAL